MAILSKGHTFGATDQVTSTKLNNLVDASAFVSGGSGTCVSGGGLEVTTGGQLQVKDDDLDFAKLSDDAALTSGRFGIMNMVYPVGTIYQSTIATNPDELFFGNTDLTTWVAVGVGRVLVGKASSGTFGSAGATGGAENVTLAQDEIPNHVHKIYYSQYQGGDDCAWANSASNGRVGGNNIDRENRTSSANSSKGAEALGGTAQDMVGTSGQSHTNLQPYEVVYMWKRTA
jgi:microcystin-dependent protein